MDRTGLTNAGAGKALLYTRLMLEIQALRFVFIAGGLPVLILPMLFWFWTATPMEYDLVKIDIVSQYFDGATARRWYLRDGTGEKKLIVANIGPLQKTDVLTPSQVKKALSAEWQVVATYRTIQRLSMWGAPLLAISIWLFIFFYGKRSQRAKRIRGAQELVTDKELSALVQADGPSYYEFANVHLPKHAPSHGICALGAQGSGKSVAIHDLMNQVFAKGRKCIIYDHSGEFFRAYFRPGIDHFFNPALLGSVPWSLFSELNYTYDADTLSQAFLPPKESQGAGPNAFFEDAARALFSVIILRLAQRGAKHTADIARAFLEMPDDEMNYLIEKSVASSAVGGDSKGQRQGVISSIAIYLNGIKAVQPGLWSITDFISSTDTASDARLFLLNTEDTKAMFAPLYRLLLSVSFSVIAARQEIVHEDRYWYFLDEIHTIGDIKLDDQLATLRKFGVCIVTGIQSESQFMSSMGKNRGETVMNGFNTLLQLRANDAEMLERAARRLGETEVQKVNVNQQLGVVEWRDGASLQFTDAPKKLVMPSDIGELGTCQGFLRIAGSYPVARVNYSHWLRRRWFGLLPAHVSKFAERCVNPERDPQFKLVEAEDVEAGADVLAKVSADALARKQLVEAEKRELVEAEKREKNPELQETNPEKQAEHEGEALPDAPLGNDMSSIEFDISKAVEVREIS